MNCEALVTVLFRKGFLQLTQVLFQIVAEMSWMVSLEKRRCKLVLPPSDTALACLPMRDKGLLRQGIVHAAGHPVLHFNTSAAV